MVRDDDGEEGIVTKLDTWKAIAGHLGVSVRTAQRYAARDVEFHGQPLRRGEMVIRQATLFGPIRLEAAEQPPQRLGNGAPD